MVSRSNWRKVALLTSIALVGAWSGTAHATTINVNDTADELNSDGSCSLREAIQAANSDSAVDGCPSGNGADVINVPAGTYLLGIAGADEDSNATGDLDITTNIELIGAGANLTILDGGKLDRVIDVRCIIDDLSMSFDCVNPVVAKIAGITIRNGLATIGRGGGFRNTGSAGPSSTGPTTLLENCRVTSNIAAEGGGVGDEGTLTIRNSLIDHNIATTYSGGGVDTFGVTVIEDSEISNNEATGAYGNGGGVYNNAKMTILRTLIAANRSSGHGGGFMDINGQSVLENVTISGNTASATGGGAVCGDEYNGCNIMISHCTIANNTAAGGGGLAVVTGSGYSPRSFTVANSIVATNSASDVAGAFVSNGHNIVQSVGAATGFTNETDLINVNARLVRQLGQNGGPTRTHALKTGSPAIDGGSCKNNVEADVVTDQRGVARPFGVTCDVGAYEFSL